MAKAANTATTNKATTQKKKMGRPLFDGKSEETVILKLEEAFGMGCTALEACLFADISKSSFYSYLEKHPDFQDRIDLLKERPILQARDSMIRAMRFDGNLALKFLERKRKSEFALRTEMTGKDGADLVPIPILGGASQEKKG